MVRYTEWASEGLAHHFAVESDELRLKTNVRGGALSAHLADTVVERRVTLNVAMRTHGRTSGRVRERNRMAETQCESRAAPGNA